MKKLKMAAALSFSMDMAFLLKALEFTTTRHRTIDRYRERSSFGSGKGSSRDRGRLAGSSFAGGPDGPPDDRITRRRKISLTEVKRIEVWNAVGEQRAETPVVVSPVAVQFAGHGESGQQLNAGHRQYSGG
jgi:hypothetical protein